MFNSNAATSSSWLDTINLITEISALFRLSPGTKIKLDLPFSRYVTFCRNFALFYWYRRNDYGKRYFIYYIFRAYRRLISVGIESMEHLSMDENWLCAQCALIHFGLNLSADFCCKINGFDLLCIRLPCAMANSVYRHKMGARILLYRYRYRFAFIMATTTKSLAQNSSIENCVVFNFAFRSTNAVAAAATASTANLLWL